jgi:hypothetical protein
MAGQCGTSHAYSRDQKENKTTKEVVKWEVKERCLEGLNPGKDQGKAKAQEVILRHGPVIFASALPAEPRSPTEQKSLALWRDVPGVEL